MRSFLRRHFAEEIEVRREINLGCFLGVTTGVD